MKTPGKTKQSIRMQAVMALALMFQTYITVAENSLTLKKTSANTIAVELSNADGIAGIQFSINACGGIVLRSYECAERARVAGIAVYQYAKNDSTLNVVILAPVRFSLSAGQGAIGIITFSSDSPGAEDSARVFFSHVVISDADAHSLVAVAVGLAWSKRGEGKKHSVDFVLEENYPNPFNPSTTIAYTLQGPGNVRLAVYDIGGRLVAMIVNQYQREGRYLVKWNAIDGQGSMLASGMYFARLQMGDQVAIRKMMVTK